MVVGGGIGVGWMGKVYSWRLGDGDGVLCVLAG